MLNRELLEKPFSPEQIKQRTGSFGKTLDYVEAHAVIQRLNDAFEGSWSFEIISHEIFDEEVLVQGKLIAAGIVKTQFGSSTITKTRDGGAVISLAADLKAAATDALKKCSTLLGVGLHLYGCTVGEENPRQDATQSRNGGNAMPPSRPSQGKNEGSANGDGRISNKQLTYLIDIGKGIGMDSKALDKECLEVFGVRMAYLTRKDASVFIDSLKRKAA